jgi:heme-degrading monooxygenase HmoA
MFAVIYQFTVKEGREEDFKHAWATVTEAIYRNCGSLGSRLHISTKDPLAFIAYAQWPSEEFYDKGFKTDSWTEEEKQAKNEMKEMCCSIETLHRTNMVDDRLR